MPENPNEADFRHSLVAAVQAELQRHAANIGAEMERLRKEAIEDRASLRAELKGQLGELARMVEEVQAQAAADLERSKSAFEARILDSENRQARRLDDVTTGMQATVEAAAQPILADMATENERAVGRLEQLEAQLHKFDEQAARMVTYVHDAIQKTEARQSQMADDIQARVATEVSVMRPLVDEIDSSVRRFQREISTQVSSRLNEAEDRFNSRLMAAEARMKETAGAQIADVQAHVGRVNAHIDDTLAVLNNRHEQVNERFEEADAKLEALAESVRGVDSGALDEMREKVSSAVGEAMLVRIEMERLEKTVSGRTDELTVRITEVETQLIDATMDVSTAIQLDRLEELERAVLELDPSRFPAYDPSAAGLKRPEPAGAAAASEPAEVDVDADQDVGVEQSEPEQPPASANEADAGQVEPAEQAVGEAEPETDAEVAEGDDDAAPAEMSEPAEAPAPWAMAMMPPPPSAAPLTVPPLSPVLPGLPTPPASAEQPEHGTDATSDFKDSLNGSSALAEEHPEPAPSSFAP